MARDSYLSSLDNTASFFSAFFFSFSLSVALSSTTLPHNLRYTYTIYVMQPPYRKPYFISTRVHLSSHKVITYICRFADLIMEITGPFTYCVTQRSACRPVPSERVSSRLRLRSSMAIFYRNERKMKFSG